VYKSAALWFGLFVVCCILLFQTSQRVTDGRQKLSVLQRDLMDEEETLRVLQAEWSYLNQPERLEKLSREYLKLAPMKGQQFTKAGNLPLRPAPEAPATQDLPPQLAQATPPEAPLAPTPVAVTAAEIATADKTAPAKRPSKRPPATSTVATSARPPTPQAIKPEDRAYQPPHPTPARTGNPERRFGDVIQSLGVGTP